MKLKIKSRYPSPSMESPCIDTHFFGNILPGHMPFWTFQICPKSGTPPYDIHKNMSQNTLFCVTLYKFTPKYSKKRVNFCDGPVTAKTWFLASTDQNLPKPVQVNIWAQNTQISPVP